MTQKYTRDQMIEKVRKVLELAKKTSYEGEAQTAFTMAQKLMAEYNLSEAEIEQAAGEAGFRSEVTSQKVDEMSKGTFWKEALADLLSKHFRCIVHFSGWNPKDKMYTRMQALGQSADLQIFAEVYNAAVFTIVKQAKKFRADRRKELRAEGEYYSKEGSRAACISWVKGFIAGMEEKLNEMKQSLVKENAKYALILVTPNEVKVEAVKRGWIISDEQQAKWQAEQDRRSHIHKERMETDPAYQSMFEEMLKRILKSNRSYKPKATDRFDLDAYRKGQEKGKQFDPTIRQKLTE